MDIVGVLTSEKEQLIAQETTWHLWVYVGALLNLWGKAESAQTGRWTLNVNRAVYDLVLCNVEVTERFLRIWDGAT